MRCRFLHIRRSAIVLQVRDLVQGRESIMVRVGGKQGGGRRGVTSMGHKVQA